ncbi:MAG: T9SS type A sorting domain-containing protein [Bacteroidota bacterium]
MKKIIFALLFITPILLHAQDYTNICSGGPSFFQKYNSTMVKAYKTTSFTLPGSNDTIFYSYATIRDTAASCMDTTKGSIFGKKVYRVAQTKSFFFFNKRKDTVRIEAKAVVGYTWKFVNLSSGTYLQANVLSMDPDSVLGVLDNVMKVELQAKRYDGTPVTNPWNGKTFKLSAHYGLAKTYDMVNVPFDTTSYTLVGRKSPALGLQDFGWKEVYAFNIGDILHFSGYDNGLAPGQTSTWKEIKTVFAKTTWGANDSVQYKFDRCRSTVTNPGNNHVYIHDTLTVKYNFKTLANDSSIMRFPDQFIRENIYATQYDRYMKAYNVRQTKKLGQDKYRFINTCFVIPAGSVLLNDSYTEGLGLSEYYRDDQTVQNYYKCVYYKKGTEIWGSPVGTQCSPLLDVQEQNPSLTQQVRIVPNPMKNQAELILEGVNLNDNLHLVMYNVVGKEVYNLKVTSSSMVINRNNLPTGLYIYLLTGKETIAKGKLVIE